MESLLRQRVSARWAEEPHLHREERFLLDMVPWTDLGALGVGRGGNKGVGRGGGGGGGNRSVGRGAWGVGYGAYREQKKLLMPFSDLEDAVYNGLPHFQLPLVRL